ncbi:MAG: diaminopimelate epimerase [Euryarchaeota archaeon]|nr:diaminopimelate epimerase [Euryarchaeota archaeon]
MDFCKYHGAGNDFVVVDNLQGRIREGEKPGLARRLCHRRFGVGADGLILVEPSGEADVRMRIFNPDGSEAEMCGNGIRCLAKHVHDSGLVPKEEIAVETMAGVKEVALTVEDGRVTYVRVDMGRPRVSMVARTIGVEDGEVEVTALDTGVPHVVVFTDDLDGVDVRGLGAELRYRTDLFPRGTNVNFVQGAGDNTFRIRTYERGVEAETLACGTGITASGVAAVILGKADPARPVEFRARGGTVFIEVEMEGGEVKRAYMRGPVEFVFRGQI